MEHTAIDELAERNHSLQRLIAAHEATINVVQGELVEERKKTGSEKRKAGLAAQAKHDADRLCGEALRRKEALEHQVNTLRDQKGRIGKLEAKNKSLTEKVILLTEQIANRAREVTDEVVIAALREEIKGLKKEIQKLVGEAGSKQTQRGFLQEDLEKAQRLVELKKQRVSHLEGLLSDQSAAFMDLRRMKKKISLGIQTLGKKRILASDKGSLLELLEELKAVTSV